MHRCSSIGCTSATKRNAALPTIRTSDEEPILTSDDHAGVESIGCTTIHGRQKACILRDSSSELLTHQNREVHGRLNHLAAANFLQLPSVSAATNSARNSEPSAIENNNSCAVTADSEESARPSANNQTPAGLDGNNACRVNALQSRANPRYFLVNKQHESAQNYRTNLICNRANSEILTPRLNLKETLNNHNNDIFADIPDISVALLDELEPQPALVQNCQPRVCGVTRCKPQFVSKRKRGNLVRQAPMVQQLDLPAGESVLTSPRCESLFSKKRITQAATCNEHAQKHGGNDDHDTGNACPSSRCARSIAHAQGFVFKLTNTAANVYSFCRNAFLLRSRAPKAGHQGAAASAPEAKNRATRCESPNAVADASSPVQDGLTNALASMALVTNHSR